jgi:hypothetical protein
MNAPHPSTLRRVDARTLKVNDCFVYHQRNVYKVILITDNFIHSVNLSTERTIRFSRSNDKSPDYVYSIPVIVNQRVVDDFSGQSFLLGTPEFIPSDS